MLKPAVKKCKNLFLRFVALRTFAAALAFFLNLCPKNYRAMRYGLGDLKPHTLQLLLEV